MDLSIIKNTKWHELDGAYGKLNNAENSLLSFISGDEEAIDEAIYGFLHSEICHQYTTYSGTPIVIDCLRVIFQAVEFDDSHLIGILDFLNACTYSAADNLKLLRSVLAWQPIFEQLAVSKEGKSAEIANQLLQFCEKNSD